MKLKHVCLYAKGWYQKSDDIWEDLIKCLKADDFTPFTKSDVLNIIVGRFIKFFQEGGIFDVAQMLLELSPADSWKYGYYTTSSKMFGNKADCPEYDYCEALIRWMLSKIRFEIVDGLSSEVLDENVLPLTKTEQ